MLTGFGGMMKFVGEHPADVDTILRKPVTLAKFRGESSYDKMVKLAQSETEDAPRKVIVPAWDPTNVGFSE